MSSYLWIGGTIQPDTTRRASRLKTVVEVAVAVAVIMALMGFIVRTKAATRVPTGGPTTTTSR